jgi:hypothetical protein
MKLLTLRRPYPVGWQLPCDNCGKNINGLFSALFDDDGTSLHTLCERCILDDDPRELLRQCAAAARWDGDEEEALKLENAASSRMTHDWRRDTWCKPAA